MSPCLYVCLSVREDGGDGRGGGGGGSLIPEENVEEINLNYKDEASLESGTGWAMGEWGEGEEGRHYSFFLVLWLLFSFFPNNFPLWPVFFTSLCAELYEFTKPWWVCVWIEPSVSALSLVLSSHRQQMSRFLREHVSLIASCTFDCKKPQTKW